MRVKEINKLLKVALAFDAEMTASEFGKLIKEISNA